MEKVWSKAIEQLAAKSPELAIAAFVVGAIVFIVVVFLRHIRDKEERDVKIEAARSEAIKLAGEACHAHQRDLTDRIEAVFEKVSTSRPSST